ncbi:MAG: biotin--[acetyl-CoA-carboxylase] ligase [Massilia sp.]|nr:biotin--[acetyl-CoA-carboxylase] ligase [Massilia sp.]
MSEQAASLSSAAIAAHRAAPASASVAIEVVHETGSTNADLIARGAAGTLRAPLLLVAEHQTAGRGRAGRSWLSEAGNSLTFSLAWRFTGGAQRLLGLPLAVGVALAEALAHQGVQVQLKWPNDILKDGAKLAGILIETQNSPGASGATTVAVIGIGLNLIMPQQLEQKIGREVAAAPWLARMDRNALLAALLDALATALLEFDRHGFSHFAARWNRLHAWAGQSVRIVDNGATLQQGTAAGVDDHGRLLLDTAAGRVAVAAGDVSLRLDTF